MLDNDKFGKILVPLAKYANLFDDIHESMVDGVMCTKTCPCYKTEP